MFDGDNMNKTTRTHTKCTTAATKCTKNSQMKLATRLNKRNKVKDNFKQLF